MALTQRPILLVEDNPMDVDLTLQTFEEHNILNPVHVCRDGEEARAYILKHATCDDENLPILVLLDLRLPKVDGLSVLQEAKKHATWKKVPFVVLTTSSQNKDIDIAYEMGANSYIVKPVDFTAFADVVRTIKRYWLITNEPPFPQGTTR